MKKKAFITGVTGQDGALLARFLLKKGYQVLGLKRKSSSFNTERVDEIFKNNNFYLEYGDLSDNTSLIKIIKNFKPHEVYNLAAQSHVKVSFDIPEYTSNITGLGTLRVLEAIRSYSSKSKFYQASSSEMFGHSSPPQNENTKFCPQSPYGAAKLYSYWITKIYRESYGIFASNGILFNHESHFRGETFVTKKIISSLIQIKYGIIKSFELGNLYALRDWGDARDYVEGMWRIINYKKPDDFVLATGKKYSVKDFINFSCFILNLKIKWVGKGLNERCLLKPNNQTIIKISKKYFRPLEVDSLLGDFKKAKKLLNWKPKISLKEMIKNMIVEEEKKLNVK